MCTGCMACVNVCVNNAIQIKDEVRVYNAVIDENKCINCNACYNVCQVNHLVEGEYPIAWYQGWAKDECIREKGSSGGVATEIAKSFIEDGGSVCSCVFEEGEFAFSIVDKIEQVYKFAGSKYVKSNPKDVYIKIRKELQKNRKMLFIGLPCQVAALKKFLSENLQKNLYTIDLICHGTPSPKLLEIFLEQYQYKLTDMSDISFRVKRKFQIYDKKTSIITNGVCDRYSIAFLNALIYTENCYSCRYAKIERVSDITLGDSWGSELSDEEKKKGISFILCQTEKGRDLLEKSDLQMQVTDLQKEVLKNKQLSYPSKKHLNRNLFFEHLKMEAFNQAVFQCIPKQCIRQNIKEILVRLGLYSKN